MIVKETFQLLDAQAEYAHANGSTAIGEALQELRTVLAPYKKDQMRALVNRYKAFDQSFSRSKTASKQALSSDVIWHLRWFEGVLRKAKSTARANDLRQLIKMVEGTESDKFSTAVERLGTMLKKPDPKERIRTAADRLMAAEGDEKRFNECFSKLSTVLFTRPDIVEIAGQVYGSIPKSTTKARALSYIRQPHDARMRAKRGVEAMRDRSAA